MLFNSPVFLQFFAAFLFLHWLCRHNLQARNILIVVASYVFYGAWNWKLLTLLLASTLLDYAVGLALARTTSIPKRKMLLFASIAGNLSILGFFKYAGFFVDSLKPLLTSLGFPFNLDTLDILLPVGISFYTFQTMSYTIDIYRGEMKPTRNLVNFAAYVSFFPQLVAGPIERARGLLPQFERTLTITRPMLQVGLWLCIWGMFKKVVVADNLAPLVEMVYSAPNPAAPGVILATIAFAFQIYCDFSGYSDIARGTAKIIGFDIMVNFNVPYAATNIREFWRRWHISLSTWLRDYLYVSLGGNRRGNVRGGSNVMITMLLGGLWHGASWHYVLWGFWHGAGLIAHRLFNRLHSDSQPPTAVKATGNGAQLRHTILSWFGTMTFVLYGWLLFRAESLDHIVQLTSALTRWVTPLWLGSYLINLAFFITPIVAMDIWLSIDTSHNAPTRLPWWGRSLLQGTATIAIFFFWEQHPDEFIYFQF